MDRMAMPCTLQHVIQQRIGLPIGTFMSPLPSVFAARPARGAIATSRACRGQHTPDPDLGEKSGGGPPALKTHGLAPV